MRWSFLTRAHRFTNSLPSYKIEEVNKDKLYQTPYYAFVINLCLPFKYGSTAKAGRLEKPHQKTQRELWSDNFRMDGFYATEPVLHFAMMTSILMNLFRLLTLQN